MTETRLKLYQPEPSVLNTAYEPHENTVILENPPRFTWMPAKLNDDIYVLEISSDINFQGKNTRKYRPVYHNFFTPSQPLNPGTYYWRYALLDDEDPGKRITTWSNTRKFTVPEDLPQTPLLSRTDRYKDANVGRPRLWLSESELENFKMKIMSDSTNYNFNIFYEKSVKKYLTMSIIEEPKPYPNHERTARLWREMYVDCQEVLYAIRHLSVAGLVLNDIALIEKAKEWLLHICTWDPNGPTSRDYNDEAAFRVAAALAWGYDWLNTYLSEREKILVREMLFIRTEQVAFHVMKKSKIHQVPYDSHAVRSLSTVLIPCSIALFEDVPEARNWLNYTLEYFSGIYTPWGGEDGGWAEGPHYWLMGVAYVIDAINLIKKFNGHDLYQRPFFQKTGDFPLYVYPPYTIRASFGDQANLGEMPGLKLGYNVRQFAGVTGNPYYQWYYEQVKKYDTNPYDKFYNKGWWDFYFDEMMFLHDYPQIEAKDPSDLPTVKWFRDVGWVAMHKNMHNQNDHIMYVTKSSEYGSISHSHGDQNAFVLHAFGEPLAIHSGYYVAFNSTMHTKWRRQTISKNAILIDGIGQYAGMNKFEAKKASGEIKKVEEHENYAYILGDATNAFKKTVPYINSYTRETYFVGGTYFVIVDTVDLGKEASIDWLIHSFQKMDLKNQSFMINGEKAKLQGDFVYCSSGELKLEQYNNFPDVDLSEIEGKPIHWRLQAKTNLAKHHQIVTLLQPMKKQEPKYITYFMDDQGFMKQFYFTEDGKTFQMEIPKFF